MSVPMHPVQSTNLAYVGWEEEGGILYITFKKGVKYKYPNVPYATFLSLKNSPSPGTYYRTNIQGIYDGEKF